MLEYKTGDLIAAFKAGEIGVIAHQSNCFCTMGSGVALSIKKNFPDAYMADCRTVKGDKRKLGTWTSTVTKYGPVFNLYGQFDYGKDGARYTKYEALYSAMNDMARVLRTVNFNGKIGLPKIGCGTAGGNWSIVSMIIEEVLSDWEVIIYEL